MQVQTINAEVRPDTGKQTAGRMRRQGKVPGVIYGKKVGNLPLAVPRKELERVLDREGGSALLKVIIGGQGQAREFTAMVREVQRHPIKGEIIHIDFHQISLDEEIRATVPIVLEGEARGVRNGGILQYGLREVEVEALPADLPETLTIDISDLDVGEHLSVADIKAPRGVKILTEPDAVIATIVSTRAVEAEEDAAPDGETQAAE
ncbi:MAG: 50S ribosomal protein L25/general stress protein Ctc [Moorella humiferrea]|uniref:Large ribosomal subunit protein bL25 n=1 Tax=Neomoorella humiferrea TaxID=676965 RepID=A0A2T0ATU0_9FIRM|nr:50S ribosomal protein L25/general stress protein Ctc [Moorella humiferrea]MBE3571411.1 50S ribosomal protein L25/general stress protein Ctc [Moorella humiferrea]PRR73888.1 General stress protein CTC [Moorella humiferrea]